MTSLVTLEHDNHTFTLTRPSTWLSLSLVVVTGAGGYQWAAREWTWQHSTSPANRLDHCIVLTQVYSVSLGLTLALQ